MVFSMERHMLSNIQCSPTWSGLMRKYANVCKKGRFNVAKKINRNNICHYLENSSVCCADVLALFVLCSIDIHEDLHDVCVYSKIVLANTRHIYHGWSCLVHQTVFVLVAKVPPKVLDFKPCPAMSSASLWLLLKSLMFIFNTQPLLSSILSSPGCTHTKE